MTNPADNPHQDYRRQTDQHYGSVTPPAPPPRISRGVPEAGAVPEPATEQIRVEPDETQQLPVLPTSRFTAGTTYTARTDTSGATPSPPDPASPTAPAQQRVMPVVAPPQIGAPAQQIPSPTPPPHQQKMPVTAPPPPAPPTHQTSTPAAAARFDLQPSHAMWGLTAVAVLAALTSGVAWILVVGGCAYGAWHLGQRRVQWPPDVQELLSRFGLAPAPPAAPGATVAPPAAYIPFRPMTFSEIFTGAFRVVSRNWPTLIGIPLALFLAAGLGGAGIGYLMMQFMFAAGGSLFSSMGSLIVVMVIFSLLVYAVALPLDALLISLGVTATDKAVRGERIRMTEILSLARQRMFAVVRLTLAFYSIFIVSDVLVYTIVIAAILSSSLAAGAFFYFLLLVANFVLGIMFSLAPVVVVVEHRGVVDSFKRSIQLVKSAWGRILAIHLLWAVCAIPLLMLPSFVISFVLGPFGMLLFMIIGLSLMIALTRTLQLLVYTDLRMRQEHYEQELIADWARNTRV